MASRIVWQEVQVPAGEVVDIMTHTINAPADGFVLAIATMEYSIWAGNNYWAYLGNSRNPQAVPVNGREFALEALAFHIRHTITILPVYPVTKGESTFCLVTEGYDEGFMYCYEPNLTLIYLPTAYGSVTDP